MKEKQEPLPKLNVTFDFDQIFVNHDDYDDWSETLGEIMRSEIKSHFVKVAKNFLTNDVRMKKLTEAYEDRLLKSYKKAYEQMVKEGI